MIYVQDCMYCIFQVQSQKVDADRDQFNSKSPGVPVSNEQENNTVILASLVIGDFYETYPDRSVLCPWVFLSRGKADEADLNSPDSDGAK